MFYCNYFYFILIVTFLKLIRIINITKTITMKNLRVAVVPTETQNSINQRSTVEEILACEETVLYPLTDYFKAQNDEEIDLLHWSFLIDIEKNIDLTGTNINGVHYYKKPIE